MPYCSAEYSRKLGKGLKIDHNHFIPYPLKFMINK